MSMYVFNKCVVTVLKTTDIQTDGQTDIHTKIINLRSKASRMLCNTWVLHKETRTTWKVIYLPEVLYET